MKFGSLFKQHRLALGITLREFCRRNDLNAGNISRLESGALPPPQSEEILKNYANAFKLKEGSPEWDTFMEVAAVENGRLTADLQENLEVLKKMEKKRGGWTKSIHLEHWADLIPARYMLPRLIKKLARDSVTVEGNLLRLEMSADEGVQNPGPDGLVEVVNGNEYVPTGMSVWEMGTDKDCRKKANDDFEERTKKFQDFDKKQIVFVFVTPRKWPKRNDWCKEKIKLGIWKDVRVIDSSRLEEWLEVVPSVDLWFASQIGIRPEGILSIEDHWKNISTIAKPNLLPSVFLSSRERQIKKIVEWLAGPPSVLTFEAYSPNEIVDFVAAYIASLDEKNRDLIKPQIVIVEEKSAWRSLSGASGSFALIAKPSLEVEPEMVSEAVRKGRYVLILATSDTKKSSEENRLPRVYYSDLEKALVKSGYSDQMAGRLARESGGSLSILKRRLPSAVAQNRPEWSKPQEAAPLLPILLLGGWDENNKADIKVVEKLTGETYEKVVSILNRWRASNESLILRIQNSWNLISREDSWELLSPYLLPNHIEKFEKLSLQILNEIDPRYDLPAGERWYAALKNKTPKYSARLKQGIVETLALLGAKPPTHLLGQINISARVEHLVSKLLEDKDWKSWASLEDYLTYLAEASPEAFLKAIEKDLVSPAPQLSKLFGEGGDDVLFSSCLYAGVLWALEGLAWTSTYLLPVSLLLAKLSDVDPGTSKWGNNPFASLTEIFSPWFTQTTAPMEQRLEALKKIMKEYPKVGWKLLVKLLPSSHAVASHTHRPYWRDWSLAWTSGVSREVYWNQVRFIAEHLIENAGYDGERIADLVKKADNLSKPIFEKVVKKLESLDLSLLGEEGTRKVFDALRQEIHHHKAYATADWAMSTEMLEALETVRRRFEPSNPLHKHQWLFVGWPELPEEKLEMPYEKRQEIIFARRLEALNEIIEYGGISQIISFAEMVESPQSIGFVLGKTKNYDDDILPKLLVSKIQKNWQFAFGYVFGRFAIVGWEWVAKMPLSKWAPEESAKFILNLSFERESWNLIDRLGQDVERHYWSNQNDYLSRSGKLEDVEYVISMFLKYKRPFKAIEVLGMALHDKHAIKPSTIIQVLDACLEPIPETKEIRNHDSYQIQELFSYLQKHPDTDRQKLIGLEWAYLKVLDDHGHGRSAPRSLHDAMGNDPGFFIDILSKVYHSKKEAKKPVPKETQKIAENAYRLLNSWRIIPGTIDGKIDSEKMNAWIAEARRKSTETGFLDACENKIGELFAHSPHEADGSWPCIAVRDAIEDIKSERLERGFEISIHNKRGGFSKSLTEGGQQERELSKTYGQYADSCALKWPRTAASLRRISKSYESEARREDERAEERL